MPTSKICLIDANVWIALATERHEHHGLAANWFESLEESEASFCRVTQMSFLRLLTNVKVMREDSLAATAAWAVYKNIRRDWRVSYATEPLGLEDEWIRLMKTGSSGANTWTDAYLAALAITKGFTFVSFDQAFHRWRDLRFRPLQ
jgi:uncharacterized protein